MKRRAVRMIGTTHFDPVWMWTWDEGMASIRSTFRSALDRMNEDENFVYSFSAPPVFEWIREVDPPMFEEIRRRVREGRWELVEGWWVQPHCFSSLGETYVRQGLYGQRYLSDTFGVRSKTAFNTDSFGHCVTLPQILRLCGIEGYVFGRPSDAQQELPSPFFRWRGIDGSTVLAFRFGGGDANAYSTNLERDIPSYAENAARKGHDSLMVYGVSNHGGAPTKAAIAAINKFKTGSKLKCDVDFSRLDDFFGAAESDCPTEYDQELVTSDFGVYINGVSVKQRQRECEIALLNAEKSALIANRGSGRAYPKEKLAELWCDALFNQFHDIIGGASVPEAFTDAGNLHGKILWETKKIIHYSLQSVTREIDTSGEAFPVVAWNLNSFEFKFAIEAELQWAWEFEWYDGPLTLRDAEGRHIPSQIIQETSALPRFRSRFLFEDTLPSLGYALYHVNREEQPEIHSDLTVGKNSLENSKLKIIFSETNGGLQSVIDKESGEAIFHNTVVPVIMDDPGCVWTFNIGSGFEREVGRFEFEKLIVLEKGPLRAKVRIVSCFGNSVCEQDFSLRKNSPEIEGTLNVFWNEKNKALKLAFASGAGGVEVVKASTPYGWVERKRRDQELPMGDWLGVEGKRGGFSLVTKGVSAYSASDAGVALTLLRSPVFAHLAYKTQIDDLETRSHLDQGWHAFSWKLRSSALGAALRPSEIERSAEAFNNSPVVIDEAAHVGVLSGKESYLSIKSGSVVATSLKMAEGDSDDIVVRLVEFDGLPADFALSSETFALASKRAMKPHQILTLRTNGESILEVDCLEEASENCNRSVCSKRVGVDLSSVAWRG